MSYRTLLNSKGVRLAAKQRQPRQDKPERKRALQFTDAQIAAIKALLGRQRIRRKLYDWSNKKLAELVDRSPDLPRVTKREYNTSYAIYDKVRAEQEWRKERYGLAVAEAESNRAPEPSPTSQLPPQGRNSRSSSEES